MPRANEGLNPEVARIATAMTEGLSLEQAAIRLNYRLSRTAIGDLKKGKVGWEQTARAFAEGFWERACELFEGEISAQCGECTREAVSDWFAEKAGFGRRYSARPGETRDLTYEPVLDEIDVRHFRGAQGLPPEDVDTLNAIVRTYLSEKRRQRGLD